jgi:hypothetical protein
VDWKKATAAPVITVIMRSVATRANAAGFGRVEDGRSP